MSTKRRTYGSLDEALRAHGVPIDNHAQIRRICEQIGITRFEAGHGHIVAVRKHGRPSLHIAYGWTNGFRDEGEARAVAEPGAECWPSDRGTGWWGISHPVNRIGHGGGGPSRPDTDYGVCPGCFQALPATRQCDDCD